MAIYDISLPISTSLAVWPGDPPIEVSQPSHLEQDPSTLTRIAMGAHSGTTSMPRRTLSAAGLRSIGWT